MRMCSKHNAICWYCIIALIDYDACVVIGINPTQENRISSNIPASLYYYGQKMIMRLQLKSDLYNIHVS